MVAVPKPTALILPLRTVTTLVSLDSQVTLVLHALEGDTAAEISTSYPMERVVFSTFSDTPVGNLSR